MILKTTMIIIAFIIAILFFVDSKKEYGKMEYFSAIIDLCFMVFFAICGFMLLFDLVN